MSHQIKVEGNFGSAQALKDVLNAAGVKFSEAKEGGETWMTFPNSRYNQYGNPLKICLSNPKASSMDSDIGRTVRGWYRDAMVGHLKGQLLMNGHAITSEVTKGQNIVLRVAIG